METRTVHACAFVGTPNRHDGCLYEAVIYFIIGGRGCYNPRLGNEAIYEERESHVLPPCPFNFSAQFIPRFVDRAEKFDRIACRQGFIDVTVPLSVRLSSRIEITAIVKRTCNAETFSFAGWKRAHRRN